MKPDNRPNEETRAANVVPFPDHNNDLTEACNWLAKVERGLSADEKREFGLWLDSSRAHLKVFIEQAQLWDRMHSLTRLADIVPPPLQQKWPSTLRSLAMAAGVLLAVVVGALMVFRTGVFPGPAGPESGIVATESQSLFETAVGEHSKITLPDGSVLTLNTNSRLVTEFSDSLRQVRLERGEVHIQVAHDVARPFIVAVADKVVRAVGTEFNLEITHLQQIELIVTEGKVLVGVQSPGSKPSGELLAGAEPSGVKLEAGEQVLLGTEDEIVERIDPDEIEVRLSWRGGDLIFRGESLAEAIDEIERYTPVEFLIQDEDLKKIRVAGLFKAGDVEGLLTTLEENFNITNHRLSEAQIILTAN
jgi:transmembrane sensor